MIVYNAIQTPDGTILESIHRHDFKQYTDKNGHTYMVDGGLDYLRRGYTPGAPEAKDLSINTDDHSIIREYFKWGTRGKDGKSELTFKLLKDLSDDHLEALIDYPSGYTMLFKQEIKYRATM